VVEIEIWFEKGSSKLEDDDGDDIEDTSDKFDLDSGDSETLTFEFDMPFDIKDGDDYTVHIEVTGENADDSSEKYTIIDESETITATREKHEVVFVDGAVRKTIIAHPQTVKDWTWRTAYYKIYDGFDYQEIVEFVKRCHE